MSNNKKLRVGVIMGGKSGEHEVSIISAASVIKALDRNRYNVIPIGITKTGKWISGPQTIKILKTESKGKILDKILLPDPNQRSLIAIKDSQISREKPLDVIIPILHGTYGEDGKVQGLFELADIPYVGAGVLGSAVGMDKIIMKKLFKQSDLDTPEFAYFQKNDWLKYRSKIIKQIESKLKYPVFVKPANLGSSVGITKAKNRDQLITSIKEAIKYDRRVIIEQAIKKVREIECAVLGNDNPKASIPGEVIPNLEFYSYEAKYIDENGAILKIPATLNKKMVKDIQEMSIKAFKILDLAGMARIDFLIANNKKIYISEVNTIPGFTSISMYPKLWEASGIPYSKLLDILIKLAIERHQEKQELKTSYNLKPKV